MKKNSLSLGTFPSPEGQIFGETLKGWSSERVPHPSSSSRRHISAAATPFYSGRTLPSKWEDAERWICSPVLGYGGNNNNNNNNGVNNHNHAYNLQAHVHSRRPKSKSGPVVQAAAGVGCYSLAIQGTDGGGRHFLAANSPFSTGVLVPEGVALHYGVIGGGRADAAMSSGLQGWSDLVSESSLPSSEDEKLDEMKDAETMVSAAPSRRDMATQMSPDHSTHSSPGGSSGSRSHLSIIPITESQSDHHPVKLEIREVQVDKRATIISWSKRHGSKTTSKKPLPEIEDFFQNARGASASSWDISDRTVTVSRFQREEAKITAWENLQKAKAESAIRKLEVNLEKKRSSSMDRILNKLRTAQMKAQDMRNSMSARQEEQQSSKITRRRKATFFRKHVQFRLLSSCITCCTR